MIPFLTTLVVGVDAPTVQAAIDLATAGDVVELPGGTWAGPVVLDKPITLTGGVLDGGGSGTVLTVTAPGAVVDALTVRGSGRDLTGLAPDACVRFGAGATGAVLRGSTLSDCTFGVWVHQTKGAQLVGNHVRGRRQDRTGARGNGIHLFDAERLVVQGNTVEDSRDGIYVSATENSVIAENRAENQRYGIHYMYSQHNEVRGNVTSHNSGGVALMQSHHLTVTDNVSSDNKDKGILFRDVQHSTIRGNTVERNGEGLFFFSSCDNAITENVLRGNDIGARVWAGTERNTVSANVFVGNRQQIFYVAHDDQRWEGNAWSDYTGWDQDDDGFGDRPYRADSFVANLLYRFPHAVLLLGSPALELLRYLEERLPALRVPTVFDDRPVTRRP